MHAQMLRSEDHYKPVSFVNWTENVGRGRYVVS